MTSAKQSASPVISKGGWGRLALIALALWACHQWNSWKAETIGPIFERHILGR